MKLIATIALTLAALVVGPAPADAATFQVIGSGDSIANAVFPNVATGQSRWLNQQSGRAPYVSGVGSSKTCGSPCFTSSLNASTVQTITWAVQSTMAGAYVVVQDGGHADKNGVVTTDAQWKSFVEDIVAVVPNNRTIVFVYPGYDESITCACFGPGYESPSQTAYRRTFIARDVFDANPAQPVVTINWWYAVHTHPIGSSNPYVQADGLHPTAAGVAWLTQQLNNAVS